MIRVLIVDDEPLALRQLEMYIGRIPDLSLVASCPSAAAARPFVGETDILFVDINMPDLSGMDFVRSLEHPPLVVFTTAYSEYALEGYRVHAADYLLKPFSFSEFEASVAHLRDRIEAARPKAEPQPEVLTFRLDYTMSEYLKIWLRDEPAPLVVLYSLKRLAGQLPGDRFLRIHRSYLVNLSDVSEFRRTSVTLSGGPTLPVGDLYRAAVWEALSQG